MAGSLFVQAQPVILMPDSTNSRMVVFDATNGNLVNNNLFALNAGTTPVHAIQVGQEIWVSEQVGDKISRYAADGTSLGTITGGMDNIRGMALIGSTVYVSNGGSGNGAPSASSVIMFDMAGNNLGFFSTAGTAPSPFAILSHQGNILVASSSANDDVHRYSSAGVSIGTFHNSTSLNFGEQMDHDLNGNVLVAGFSTNNVVRLDPNTGALINSFTASGARGLYQLPNGNILWSNSAGVHRWDGISSTQLYAGGGRFFGSYDPVPEPASIAALGLGALALMRRRRRQA